MLSKGLKLTAIFLFLKIGEFKSMGYVGFRLASKNKLQRTVEQ